MNDAQETARLLKMAILQIDTSLKESDNSMEQLIESIAAIDHSVRRMQTHLENTQTDELLETECKLAATQIQQTIIAFQFYDLLSQRISHIRRNLDEIIAVISAQQDAHPALWRNLQQRMQAVYSPKQEQMMYKALLDSPFDENSDHSSETVSRKTVTGDIEIF